MTFKELRSQVLIGAGMLAVFASGCEQTQMPQPNACPPKLHGTPSLESSAIQWRGNAQKASADTVEVSADIVAVSVECIPARHEAIETDKGRRDAFVDYDVAATATITYKIADQDRFSSGTRLSNLDVNMIFEAVSASGVVLGSGKTSFRVVGGGTSGTASTKIRGLSEEEIQRVTSVLARWEYGR